MREIEGFILAGGASSRMGTDKSALRLGGKTFVERAARALSAIEPKNLYLIGNNQKNSPDLTALPDVFAEKKDVRGSIVGLHAALFYTRTDWLAVLACDLPFASGELLKRLVLLGENENFDAVVPLQADKKIQPLCALYRKDSCLPLIEKMISGENWSLQNLLRQLKTRLVTPVEWHDLPNAGNFFFNVNTPEDFQLAHLIEQNLTENLD